MRCPRYEPQSGKRQRGRMRARILLGHDAACATDRLDDGAGDGSAPHRAGAGGGDALQGAGEVRLANAGAEGGNVGPSVWTGPEEDAGGLGVAPQALEPAGGHLTVLGAHHQALAGEADGGREDDGARQRARPLQKREVAVHRVGDGDRQATIG